jgi:hypothetical protein
VIKKAAVWVCGFLLATCIAVAKLRRGYNDISMSSITIATAQRLQSAQPWL